MNVNSSTLNIIRVIAMTGIVADHYFQASGVPILANTGLQLGGVFLMVFFATSAFLFGRKWKEGGLCPFAPKAFLKRRIVRICLPLWLVLPFVVGIEYLILGRSFNLKTILYNFIGLGWVKPFGVAGHLWYITLILFLYFVFVAFSRIRLDKLRLTCWMVGYVALLAVYVVGESHFATFSSVAPVITVFLASLLFFKSDDLMELCHRCPKSLLFITMFAFGLSWWMYVQGWHDTHKAVATFSSFSAGFGLFVCLMTFIKSPQNNKLVTHFADISYEVYLVHLPLLPLTSSVLRMVGLYDKVFVIIPWLALTYACAWGVHSVTRQKTISRRNIQE